MALVDILNAIRTGASAEYQAAVPLATRTNMALVGNPILNDTSVANEFISGMVNLIAFRQYTTRIARNPLAVFKKGAMPFGYKIEEIGVNPAKAVAYDSAGAALLTKTAPDVKVARYYRNRRDVYPVTIEADNLEAAFLSEGNMQTFIGQLINSMYSGDNRDEFLLMKEVLATAIGDAATTNKMICNLVTDIADPLGATVGTAATAFIEHVKILSEMFTFPRSEFNGYKLLDPDGPGHTTSPYITSCPVEEQALIIRADIKARLSVNVLAAAFNISEPPRSPRPRSPLRPGAAPRRG
jgi:hypothetical protein